METGNLPNHEVNRDSNGHVSRELIQEWEVDGFCIHELDVRRSRPYSSHHTMEADSQQQVKCSRTMDPRQTLGYWVTRIHEQLTRVCTDVEI